MRRCGHNPTDIEVADIINKVHDDTGSLGFEVGKHGEGSAYFNTPGFLSYNGRKKQRNGPRDGLQGMELF